MFKYYVATVAYWTSIGYDTTYWKKTVDGLKAICQKEKAEVLAKGLSTDANVEKYTEEEARALVGTAAWVQGGTPTFDVVVESERLLWEQYNPSKPYNKGNKVYESGKSYHANQNVPAGTSVTNTTYWTKILDGSVGINDSEVSLGSAYSSEKIESDFAKKTSVATLESDLSIQVTNIIQNGHFTNNTEPWWTYNCSKVVENGRVKCLASAQYGVIAQTYNFVAGRKYYIKADIEGTADIFYRIGTSARINLTASGQQAISRVITASSGSTVLEFGDSRASGFTNFYIDNILCVDLTALAEQIGVELTANQANELLKYFDGTKSVFNSKFALNKIATYENELSSLKADVTSLKGEIKIYGVKFTGSNAVGVRTDDAVGMVANVAVDGATVRNDFDNVPFFDRRTCCGAHDLNGKFKVTAYKGEPGFALDGSKGEVFYEQRPFYWNGSFSEPRITATPLEGFALAPMFANPVDKIYLPCYWLSVVGGKATSRNGTFPAYNSLDGHMTSARTYHANAHVETMKVHMTEYILQLVEFATRDLQTIMMGASSLAYSASHTAVISETAVNRIILANANADQFVVGQTIAIGTSLGSGSVCENRIVTGITVYDSSNKAVNFDGAAVNIAAGNIISSRAWANGATDIIAASSGSLVSNSSGKYPCIWRGKVDPWANGFSALCDVLIERTGVGTTEDPYVYTPYVLEDARKYSAGAITADYIKLRYTLPTADGYAISLGNDSRFGYMALANVIGGSSTTYLSDYYWYPRYSVGAVFVGGYWSNGRYCGPVCFHCGSAPSYSDINRLSRLLVTV